MTAFEDGAAGAVAMRNVADFVEKADDSGLFAELTLKPGTDPQQLLDRFVGSRVRLRRFEQVEASLNRIFLDLAGPEARSGEHYGREASRA